MPVFGAAILTGASASLEEITEGTLWLWGEAGNNIGTTSGDQNEPQQIGSLETWAQVYGGNATCCMVKTDNSMWMMADGSEGQMGDGTTISKESPVQIGSTEWKKTDRGCASGNGSTFGIKTNGTLWTWGKDAYSTHDPKPSSPVQIGTATNWASMCSLSNNSSHVMAITSANTLWVWGSGSRGRMGLGSTTSYTNAPGDPQQIGALTTWDNCANSTWCSAAVKTDNTLWAWGLGTVVGDGGQTDRSSPVQIGSLTTWSKVWSSKSAIFALKTDGTLWAWGNNAYGDLGQGNTINASSPVQIGSGTDWESVGVISAGSAAFKTDVTLWAWGLNDNGQLGQGDTITTSSPVQVGEAIGWGMVGDGFEDENGAIGG